MSEQSADATQADANATSPADTQDAQSQAETQQETISLEEAKKLRSEAAGLRKRLKDAESKVQAAADAGKSDEEKRNAALKAAEDKATAAEQRLRTANARVAVTDAASKANAISINAVFALIRDGLDFNDEGEPTNVTELITKARKDEPSLFKAAGGSTDASKNGPAGKEDDMNVLLRRASGRNG